MSGANNWESENNKKPQPQSPTGSGDQQISALLGLLGESSMTGTQRDVPEVTDVAKAIDEHVTALKKGSLTQLQRLILPAVTILTKQISSQLPGIVLHMKLGNDVFVFPVLFVNRNMTNTLEDININAGQNSRTVSMQLPPINYVTGELEESIKTHFSSMYEGGGNRQVVFVNLRVLDLEQFVTEQTLNAGRITMFRDSIMRSWEQGLNVLIAKQQVKAGNTTLPSPWVRGGNPYGHNNCAVARVEPVVGQKVRDGQPQSSNIQVRLQTSNGNNSYNNNTNPSKELVTAFGTVTLSGQFLSQYQPPVNQNQQYGYMMAPNGRPAGYKPLVPVVKYDFAEPGEQVGDNSGLASYFLGLVALLCTNGNYLFTEGVRGKTIGIRGNLATTENIIKVVDNLPQFPRQKEQILTEAKLPDLDYVNKWIKDNIAPHAVFASDLVSFGTDAAINNFLMGLNPRSPNFKTNSLTVVAIIDSFSNGGMTKFLTENANDANAWKPGKEILIPSSIMLPFGTLDREGKLYDLGEVDDIMLASLFPNDPNAIQQWRANIYGDGGQTPDKVRQYNIRMQLNQFFSSRVNLNGFGSRYFWSPAFNQALVKSIEGLGQLQATGTMGTFRNDIQTFVTGLNLVTVAAAGNQGGFVNANGGVSGNATGMTFGG